MIDQPAGPDDAIAEAEQLDDALQRRPWETADDSRVPSHVVAGLQFLHATLGNHGTEPDTPQLGGEDLQEVGRFHLRELVGRGSFGVVYRAFDTVLKRDVALKIPRLHTTLDDGLLGRFLRESEAAARLHHPHIVQVFEAGCDDSTAYLAAEYCPGLTLAELLRRQHAPVDPRQASKLVAKLADAVDHAHRAGILHRDLKPGNILLTERHNGEFPRSEDAAIEGYSAKITDFGMARFLDEESSTVDGALLGTVNYMSPEQAEGRGDAIGRGSDIYALGVILYELITLTRPHAAGSNIETIRKIIDSDAVSPRQRCRTVPVDLASICLKCLEKSPTKRYATAAELRDDLQRFTEGRPTLARPTSLPEQFWRWGRRNPAPAALIVFGVLAVLGTIVGLSVHNDRLTETLGKLARQKQRALSAAALAEAEGQRAEEGQRRASDIAYASNMRIAFETHAQGSLAEMSQALDRCLPDRDLPDYRGFEWRLLDGFRRQEAQALLGHTGPIYSSALSVDGRYLLTGGADRTARIWDVVSRDCLHVLSGHEDEVNKVAFAADGRWVATASDDGTVRVWNATTGEVHAIISSHAAPVHGIDFVADSSQLVTGGYDGTLRIWTVDGELIADVETDGKPIEDLDVSPDGTLLAVAIGNSVRTWDLTTRTLKRTPRVNFDRIALCVRFSPDGSLLAASMRGRQIHLFDTATGKKRCVLRGHTNLIHGFAVHPNARQLVSVSRDGTARSWDLQSAFSRVTYSSVNSAAEALAWSSMHDLAIVAHRDGTLSVWRLGATSPIQLVEPRQGFSNAGMRPWLSLHPMQDSLIVADGSSKSARRFTLAASGLNSETKLVLPAESELTIAGREGEEAGILVGPHFVDRFEELGVSTAERITTSDAEILAGDRDSTSQLLALGLENGDIQIWNTRTQSLQHEILHSQPIEVIHILPGGETVVAGDRSGVLTKWSIATGEMLAQLATGDSPPESVGKLTAIQSSPDGERIAVCFNSGALCVLSSRDLSFRDQVAADARLNDVAWVDNHSLLAADALGELHQWTLPDSTSSRAIFHSDDRLWSIQVASDGGDIYVTDAAGRVRIMDDEPVPDTEVRDFPRQGPKIFHIAYAHDLSQLAIHNEDGQVELWNATTMEQAGVIATDSRHDGITAFEPLSNELFVERPRESVEVWSGEQHVRRLTQTVRDAGRIAVSSEGSWVAISWKERTAGVDLFRAATGELVRHFDTTLYDGVGFSPLSGRLLLLTQSERITAFESRDFQEALRLDVGEGCRGFQISTDERRLASLHDGSGGQFLKIWDLADCKLLATLHGHTDRPLAAAFSPDTRTLATAGEDGTVRLWHVETGLQIGVMHRQTEPVFSVAFSPDGRTLAAGPIVQPGKETVRFWTVSAQ